MSFQALSLALLALSYASSGVIAGKIQRPSITVPSYAPTAIAEIKATFTEAYNDYKKYANGHDGLKPVSGVGVDNYNGWGATIIESMSTMKIMGLDTLYADAVSFTAGVNFSQSKTPQNVIFADASIRYLGGMLSAYELNGKQASDKALLDQSIKLADKLTFAWNVSNDVPYPSVDFSTDDAGGESSTIADASAATLEFGKLSELTGDPKYKQLVEKAMRKIATNPTTFPGLPPQGISPTSGVPSNEYITWDAGSDTYFDYLLKYGRLTNSADTLWITTWKAAVDSSIRNLIKISSVQSYYYLTDYSGIDKENVYVSSHQKCSQGGIWVMGAKLTDNNTMLDEGLQLIDSCWNTYVATRTGLGADRIAFIGSDGGNFTGGPPPSTSDMAFYEQHGFYMTFRQYYLRPEVFESNFYAFRATGDPKYVDRSYVAYENLKKYTKSYAAWAPLEDVDNIVSPKIDDLDPYFFSETLKYLYLTFDDPAHIDLDSWVFNAGGHPLVAPPGLPTY